MNKISSNSTSKKELTELIEFAFPGTDCSRFLSQEDVNGVYYDFVYRYSPYKDLYKIHEHILSDFPKRLTPQQNKWIHDALDYIISHARTIDYYNDHSIFEEYYYLGRETKLRKFFLQNLSKYPNAVAGIASWSFYQADYDVLQLMLKQVLHLQIHFVQF